MRSLAYQKHPYRWATIGKELRHIEEATMEDVKAFFFTHYVPSNAVMVVAGDVNLEQVKELAKKWFEPIPARPKPERKLPREPKQLEARREEVYADVPVNSIYIAFHGKARSDADYPAMDLLSDILSRGSSSRLYRSLVKEQALFSEVNAYVTGSIDPDLIVIEGKPLPHIDMAQAESLLWQQLEQLKDEMVKEEELQKLKNKIESTMVFAELSILDRAMNLAYFEALGDASLYNEEVGRYLAVTPAHIQGVAQEIFTVENSSTLIYYAKEQEHAE